MSFSSHFMFLKKSYLQKKKKKGYIIILKSFRVSHIHYIRFKLWQMFPQYINNIFI
jgi:hypothetical protein